MFCYRAWLCCKRDAEEFPTEQNNPLHRIELVMRDDDERDHEEQDKPDWSRLLIIALILLFDKKQEFLFEKIIKIPLQA